MYEVLQQHGETEEEAYRIVSEEMWKFLDPSGMQKLWQHVLPRGYDQLRQPSLYGLHPRQNALSGRRRLRFPLRQA